MSWLHSSAGLALANSRSPGARRQPRAAGRVGPLVSRALAALSVPGRVASGQAPGRGSGCRKAGMTRSRGCAEVRRRCRKGRWLAFAVTAVLVMAGLAVGPGGFGRPPAPARSHSPARAGGRAGVPQPMTRDSRTVRHANGSYTTTVYPGPVNYHTASGWRPIDSALVPAGAAGFAWRNKANRWTSWFARQAGAGYLRLRVAGQVFDFDARGAAGAAGKVRRGPDLRRGRGRGKRDNRAAQLVRARLV